jgi:hypothetical protein
MSPPTKRPMVERIVARSVLDNASAAGALPDSAIFFPGAANIGHLFTATAIVSR